MSEIKILHNYVLHKFNDNKLSLYFPHNLDVSKNPEIYRLKKWVESSGMKFKEISEDKTDILYPNSFDLSSCFYERDSYKYLVGLNKEKGIKLDLDDFFIFLYSRFLKNINVCNEVISFVYGVSKEEFNPKSLKYFDFINYSFENKPDKVIYVNDLREGVNELDYVKTRFLNANKENKIVYLTKNKKDKTKKDGQVKYLTLPKLIFKNSDLNNFHDIINLLNDYFSFEDRYLYYNIIVGLIFSQDLTKNELYVDLSNKECLLGSYGLYITETYIKLKDYVFLEENKSVFNSNVLQYLMSKSIWYLNVNILFEGIVSLCDDINSIIKNEEYDINTDDNVKVFLTGMMEDLVLGMKMMGMFLVDEINVEFKK